MSTDRPPGPAEGDAPPSDPSTSEPTQPVPSEPTEPVSSEPTELVPPVEATRPLPPVDPTQPIQPVPPVEATRPLPAVEPTQPIPATRPPATGSWASGPGGWLPPDPAQVIPAARAAYPPPFPNPQSPYPHPFQAGGWQAQPPVQQFPGAAQGFLGQPGNPGWGPAGQEPQPGWGPPAGPPDHWAAAPPQPLAGYSQPIAPPARGRGWVIALVTLATVVVISLIAAIAVPLLTQLPTRRGGPTRAPSAPVSQAPTPKPTAASPTPKPPPTLPTDPAELLKKSQLYRLKVPAKCGYQSIPSSQAAFRKQVRSLVNCENVAWRKALTTTAVSFSKPRVTFYSTSMKSPCGRMGTTFPAGYCTANATLYFSHAAYLQGRYYRLSVASFVIHEYAHHVQSMAHIFGSTRVMKESDAVTSRRIELQAHCMAHYGLTVSGLGFSARDGREIAYQWDYTNDPKGHGSTAAERYWGKRGLDANTVGACNTWSVKASKVK